MGAKTSTANGGANSATSSASHQQHNQVHSQHHNAHSPRTRTFSSSSSSATEVIGGTTNGGSSGFSLLRTIPGMHVTAANQSTIDRQRARSLSSVPDMQQNNGTAQSNYLNAIPQISNASIEAVIQQAALSQDSDSIAAATAGAIALGRVYTASSLPSHIWSLNGIKCPVCSKFVLPDDIECHLVMCLTKPRLSYNEDVLTDAKGECVICLEDLNAGDVIARLPCLCIYHKGCIDQWFDVNRSCPEHPGD